MKYSRGFLWFTKITGVPVRAYLHYRVYTENGKKSLRTLPKKCIIMSNHTSLFDYVLLTSVFFSRNIRFLCAEILFSKNPLLTFFLNKIGSIRVDRNAYDFSFVGEALDIIEGGGAVCVFPEGRLPVAGEYHPFKPGILYIALRTDAPIVPVYTDGRYGFFKKAGVVIGEPIYVREKCKTQTPSKEEIGELLSMLEEKNSALRRILERKAKKDECTN